MNTGTLAMAIAVIREGSVRGAARRLGRPVSTVGEAFECLEGFLGLSLASRADGALSLTLTGETIRRASDALLSHLANMQAVATGQAVDAPESALTWVAEHGVSMSSLSNFDAVFDDGSIRHAARRRGLSQPRLSRQMSRLEAVFDGSLLLRTTKGCVPTERGVALRQAAHGIETWLAEFVTPAAGRQARARKPLRFGAIIPLSHESRLAARLAAVVARWPSLGASRDLLVSSTTAEDLIDGLKAGRYDIALLDTSLPLKQFANLEVFSSELVMVGPPGSDADGLRALFATRPVAVPSHRSGLRHRIWEALGKTLDRAGGTETRFVDVDALSIIVNLVLDHGYLSILPIDAVTALRRAIAIARFPGSPQVRFHLVWRRIAPMSRIATMIAEILVNGGS